MQKYVYGALSKVVERDDGTLELHGIASTPARDDAGEIITADAMKEAIPDYMKWGAVREMHGKSAAGTAAEMRVDDEGATHIVAHVVDPVAIKKVQTGTYKGFSVGGNVLKRDPSDRSTITAIKLIEVSLVDRPCNPEAVFGMWKAADAADFSETDMTDAVAPRAPTNAEVRVRAEEMCKSAGKAPARYVDFLAKAREAVIAEIDEEAKEAAAKAAADAAPAAGEAVAAAPGANDDADADDNGTDDSSTEADKEKPGAAKAEDSEAVAEPEPADVLKAAIEKAQAAIAPAVAADEPVAKSAEELQAELAAKDELIAAKDAEIEALTEKVLELEGSKADLGKSLLAAAPAIDEITEMVKSLQARDAERDAEIAQLKADLAKFGDEPRPAKTAGSTTVLVKAEDSAAAGGGSDTDAPLISAEELDALVKMLPEAERGKYEMRQALRRPVAVKY